MEGLSMRVERRLAEDAPGVHYKALACYRTIYFSTKARMTHVVRCRRATNNTDRNRNTDNEFKLPTGRASCMLPSDRPFHTLKTSPCLHACACTLLSSRSLARECVRVWVRAQACGLCAEVRPLLRQLAPL